MQTASKKVINGWAMYDWASSSYNLVITSTIFPTYFEAIAVDNAESSGNTVTFLGRQFENTALYNYAIATALLIVAIMSPLLSSIADYKGNKKKFLNTFLLFKTKGSRRLTKGVPIDSDKKIIVCMKLWLLNELQCT